MIWDVRFARGLSEGPSPDSPTPQTAGLREDPRRVLRSGSSTGCLGDSSLRLLLRLRMPCTLQSRDPGGPTDPPGHTAFATGSFLPSDLSQRPQFLNPFPGEAPTPPAPWEPTKRVNYSSSAEVAGGRARGQAAAHVTRKSCQPHTVASFQNGANLPNEMMTLEVSRGRPASPWLGTGWTGPVIQGSLELSQKPQQVLRWVGGSRGLWVEAVVQPLPSPLLQLLKSFFPRSFLPYKGCGV